MTACCSAARCSTPNRSLTLASTAHRPSLTALGKRPEVFTQRRNLSFFPSRKEPPPPSEIPSDSSPATAATSNPVPSAAADSSSSSTLSYDSNPDTPPIDSAISTPDQLSSSNIAQLQPSHDLLSTYPADPLTETTGQAARSLSEVIASNPDIPLKDLLSSPEAIHSIVSKADLPSIGLTHGWLNIPGWIRDGLVSVHYYTGLPWWVTIIGTAIILRTGLVRFVISGTRHNLRFASVQRQLAPVQEKFKAAQTAVKEALTVKEKQDKQQEMQLALKEMGETWSRNDVHPLRAMKLPLIQGGIFTMLFLAVRKLASTPLPQLHQGGIGWIKDLTLPDPYFILPITSIFLTNVIVRVGSHCTSVLVFTR